MNIFFAKFIAGCSVLLSTACAEKVANFEVVQVKPSGTAVASDRALENGKKHLKNGKCKQAIHEFSKAIDRNPRNFEALYWMGVAEGMCGEYSKAYERFSVAVRFSPNEEWKARVYATMGMTMLYLGKEQESIVFFDQARAIDSRNEVVITFYEVEEQGKRGKKPKIKKKPKGSDDFSIVLRWLD